MKPKNYEEDDLTDTEEIEGPELGRLATTIPKAGASIDLGRSASYEAAKRGDIPTIRIGGRLVVPIERFRRQFE